MRTTLLTIASLIMATAALAQENWTRQDRINWKEGDFAFYQEDYAYAFDLLTKVREADSTYAPVNFELGVIQMDWFKDLEQAEPLLKSAVDAGYSEAYFHYGRFLHLKMEFDHAVEWFNRYANSGDEAIDVNTINRHIDIALRAKRVTAKPVDVRISNLGPGVNTPAKEYVPLVTPDNSELYFTSRRDDSTARLKDPNGEYFEDIYKSVQDSNFWQPAVNVGQPINSETHDATVSITADGKTMLLYRTNPNLTGGDLYISHFRNGKWSEPDLLPENINSEYQEASATLSPDKKMIIFSSNRPGGYGGKDLYRVRKLPNGEWSLPRNLGPTINTPFDEDAPHLDVDGRTLYFASEGHNTIGGFDLYRSQLEEAELWSSPVNLGYPTNTVDDDIFLTVDAGGRIGYFSSARTGGFGQQDLYSIEFIYRQQQVIVVKCEVMNIANEPVPAEITLIDKDTREVQGVYRSNPRTGKFIMLLHPLTDYKVVVESEGFETNADDLLFPFPEDKAEAEVSLAPYILRKK